jgi:hypothetical protein
MPRYYLIKNDNLLGVIDTELGDVVALPLLRSGDDMSLLNERHATNLMANLGLTPAQALAALGLADQRAASIKTVFLTSPMVSLSTRLDGPAYKLVDLGSYALYQVDSNADNLLALHQELWAKAPTKTLGLLAVVKTFGVSFQDSAARTATGMTVTEALARRDRIATYLEALGKTTTTLRAATTEDAQMRGIVEALGYTMAQLWTKMVT